MAEPITLQKLTNADIDADTLGEFANEDKMVVSRLGAEYASAPMASRLLVENGLLGATPFSTYAAMTASALVNDSYAVVTDDVDINKNGYYQKRSNAWVHLSWNPELAFKKALAEVIGQQKVIGDYSTAFTDVVGNMAIGIKNDGSVYAPKLISGDTLVTQGVALNYTSVTTDILGNIVFGIKNDGTVHIPKLSTGNAPGALAITHKLDVKNSDAILFIGDSYTASHYTVADKAYISNISNLTNYRLRNLAISGDESLDMNNRIVNDIAYFDGLKPHEVNAKYAVIASYTNDWTFSGAKLDYYKQNLSRLVESVKSLGIEPLLCTEFTAPAHSVALIKAIADEQDVQFVDCSALNNELGNLKKGIFHQGHPGTRTNGVFWLPILDAINKLPRPDQSIKIYRKRPAFLATTNKALLYKNDIERYTRFKEISVSHMRLADTNAQYYDELDGTNVSVFTATNDEYLKFGNGGLGFSDYGLIELTLKGTAQTIDSLSLNIDTNAQVYVRNYLDTASSFVGRKGGTEPTTPEYIANYNNPRGAWQLMTINTLSKEQLKGLMLKDKMQILLFKSGGFTLNDVSAEYVSDGKTDKYVNRDAIKVGNELLTNNTFDSLSNWVTVGTPTTIVPIDNYNSPRLPTDRTSPVNKVVTVSNSKTVGRTITLPKLGARYRITVWCRYFAKAFIDNSVYALDAAQVIDKSAGNTYPTNSQITSDTADFRTLQLKYGFAATLTDTNSVTVNDFACLSWRGVEFDIYVPDAPLAATDFTFSLSCTDGEIQIAKINLMEII